MKKKLSISTARHRSTSLCFCLINSNVRHLFGGTYATQTLHRTVPASDRYWLRESTSEFQTLQAPVGKEIKVTGIGKMDFANSDSALVMNYLTDISIDDKVALRKEVDEIWSMFQKT